MLDLMLPGRDGIEILATLRKSGLGTPVLILTARDAVEDRVLGLDTGADDYLLKPFAFPELLARVRALLRRGRPDQILRLKAADLEMDLISRRVTRGGRPIELIDLNSVEERGSTFRLTLLHAEGPESAPRGAGSAEGKEEP